MGGREAEKLAALRHTCITDFADGGLSAASGTVYINHVVVSGWRQVYTAFDTHLDALGVYKLDTVGDAFVVVAGLDGFKSKEVNVFAGRFQQLRVVLSGDSARQSLSICLPRMRGPQHEVRPGGIFLSRRSSGATQSANESLSI